MSPAPLCPRDRKALAPAGQAATHACETCDGLFLQTPEIKAALEANGVSLQSTRTLYDLPIPLPCPACTAPMKGMVINSVEVDLCDACHGAWMDKGELEKVSAYIHADHKRPYPKSPSDPDDFGIFGGAGESILHPGSPTWSHEYDLFRSLWKALESLLRR